MAGLKKLMIIAYSDEARSKMEKKYHAMINPSSFNAELSVNYSKSQAPGTVTPQLKFHNIPAGKIKFKLTFDGTGLVSTIAKAKKSQTVPEQIDEFRSATIQYEGSIHRPYYLTLIWGKTIYKGVLTGLSIEYKLFKPDGTPIRAEADVTFHTSESEAEAEKAAGKKSPDITHLRQVKAGDRLPNMCNNIYEGTNFYIQVAKHNQVNHLRSIKPGTTINFPPLRN